MDRLSGSRQFQIGGLAVAIRFAAVLGGIVAMAAMGAGAGWGATVSAGAAGAADAAQAPETFGVSLPSQHVAKSLKPQRLAPSEQAGIALGTVPEVRLQAIDRD